MDATTPNLVRCYMFHPFALHADPCYVLFGVVAQSLKLVKLLRQQLPTFLFFRDGQTVAQQSWIHLHSSSNTTQYWGHAHALHMVSMEIACINMLKTRQQPNFVSLQSLMGCILPIIHCTFLHCLELLPKMQGMVASVCAGLKWFLHCLELLPKMQGRVASVCAGLKWLMSCYATKTCND